VKILSAELALRHEDALGECPLWDDRQQALWWVDIRGPGLHRWTGDGAPQSWSFDEPVGSIAFTNDGALLLAMQAAVRRFDPAAGTLTEFARPAKEPATNRFNDGRCDRAGRFWVGTMSDGPREPVGSLYRVDPDGKCKRQFGDVVVPNSLAWSPDNRTMYYSDTHRHTLWSFEFDLASGKLGRKRVFADLSPHKGRPDGSAVDSEGCLWNCEYGAGQVLRYTPAGLVDRIVQLPAMNTTCCAFGGADLRTLYITTARQRLTPEQLAQQPLAGSVFAIRTEVAGLPEARFGA
jgi:sugar lactone lactonase YvrE